MNVGYNGFARDCVSLGIGILIFCVIDRLFFRVALAVMLPFVVGMIVWNLWAHRRNTKAGSDDR